jgi:hypothetical protein
LEQERWRSSHATYGSCTDIAAPSLTRYDLTCSGVSATGFTVSAAAKSGDDQNNDRASGASMRDTDDRLGQRFQTKGPSGSEACWK